MGRFEDTVRAYKLLKKSQPLCAFTGWLDKAKKKGSGYFGTVLKVPIGGGHVVAVKVVRPQPQVTRRTLRKINEKEVSMTRYVTEKLGHKYFRRVIDAFECRIPLEDTWAWVHVYEYIPYTMMGVIGKGGITADWLISVTKQIQEVSRLLSSINVRHWDLYMRNILLMSKDPKRAPQVKVADFGVAYASTMCDPLTGTITPPTDPVLLRIELEEKYIDDWVRTSQFKVSRADEDFQIFMSSVMYDDSIDLDVRIAADRYWIEQGGFPGFRVSLDVLLRQKRAKDRKKKVSGRGS